MGMITAITWSASHQTKVVETDAAHYIVDPMMEITLQGAVKNPGKRKVLRGALIKDVINDAEIPSEADLSKIKLQSKVRRGQVIHIPYQNKIFIQVEGAVEQPGEFLMPLGSRLEDLIPQIKCLPEADTRPLRKKRRLKEGETITVPARRREN